MMLQCGYMASYMHLRRTLKKMLAELFLMLLVATQVIVPSSAFVAGENVSTPSLILILLPCSSSNSPSLSYLQVYNLIKRLDYTDSAV